MSYLPTTGFRGKDTFEGKFVCRQGDLSASITAFKSDFRHNSSVDSKTTTLRISKYLGMLEINCTSPTSKAGFFSVGNTSSVLLSQSWAGVKGNSTIEVAVEEYDSNFVRVLEADFPVSVTCSYKKDDQIEVIHTWKIQLDSTVLSINDYGQEMRCTSSENSNLTLKVLECVDTLQCQISASTPRNWEKVYPGGCFHYVASRETNEDLIFKGSCASWRHSFFSGVVRCETVGETPEWTFFTSLNSLKCEYSLHLKYVL